MYFIIALLLCLGDNCDLVRAEPVSYPSYDACSLATSTKADDLGKFMAAHREEGRESELLCVKLVSQVIELDEDREAMAETEVHEAPNGNSHSLGVIPRGNTAHVTGALDNWLRIALPNGADGYVIGERLRKLSLSETNARIAASGKPVIASVARVIVPPVQAAPAPPQPPQNRYEPPAPPAQVAIIPPPPPPAPSREFRDCAQCPVMVRLPAGTFDMGSNGDASERPVHRVSIAAFAIGKLEVSEGEWAACVAANACSYKPAVVNDRLPVQNVSWQDAVEFVVWLSKTTGKPYRLPSEAEWEYAARGGTTTPYPWGPQVGINKADCNGCGTVNYSGQSPAMTGSYQSNSWGLFDMLGGVAEWTDDCWHKDYAGAPNNGTSWQTPRCPSRVLRGGSWKNPPTDITSSVRNFYDATVRYGSNGLRVASSAN